MSKWKKTKVAEPTHSLRVVQTRVYLSNNSDGPDYVHDEKVQICSDMTAEKAVRELASYAERNILSVYDVMPDMNQIILEGGRIVVEVEHTSAVASDPEQAKPFWDKVSKLLSGGRKRKR